MTFRWRYEDADGNELTEPVWERFASRGDAESWLGESWRELLSGGVHQVVLLDGAAVISGPMSLDAE
ncbi:MAG: hypothetical protein ACR2F6_18135 [Mycobacteriales bacterium]